MIVIGNILLAIAALMYAILLSAAYGPEPSSAGDAASGYAMSVILFSLVFTGCMALVAVILGMKGGFAWLPGSGFSRFALVAAGLAAIMIIAALSTALRFEHISQLPFVLRYLTGFAPALFPLVLLVSGGILLNPSIREAVSPLLYTIPLSIVLGISALACIGGAFEWMGYENQRSADRIGEMQEDEIRYHAMHLQEIEAADPMAGILPLLVFTGRYHQADVREKALAKIKTNPEWQQELIRLLDSPYYYEVYSFLDANEVADKTLFPAPLNRSILRMAEDIRQGIQTASHLNDWSFEYLGIKRMLHAVETYQEMGVDFVPAIRQVRAALDTPPPAHLKKIKFDDLALLNRWIKANS